MTCMKILVTGKPSSRLSFHLVPISWKKAALVIICLAPYSAPNKNVTYIVDFLGFKSENSQLWSLFNSYSIRHAAEMWLIVHLWKKVKCGHSLFRTLHDTQQKLDIHRTFFKVLRLKIVKFDESLSCILFSTHVNCDKYFILVRLFQNR